MFTRKALPTQDRAHRGGSLFRLKHRRRPNPLAAVLPAAAPGQPHPGPRSWLSTLFRRGTPAPDRWWQGTAVALEVEHIGRQLERMPCVNLLGLDRLELTRFVGGRVIHLLIEVRSRPDDVLQVWLSADDSGLDSDDRPPGCTFLKRSDGVVYY